MSPERRYIRLRPRYRAFAVQGEGVFLFCDRDCQLLEGQVFVDLLPFLLEGFDETSAVDALESRYSRAFVHYAFEVMAERELLTQVPPQGPATEEAFWDEMDLDSPGASSSRLSATKVGVTSICGIEPLPCVTALQAMGMPASVVDGATSESLHLVITDDYLAPSLEEIASRNRRDRRPWLLVRGAGSALWIGPWFGDDAACFECLSWRMKMNGSVEDYINRKVGTSQGVTRAVAYSGVHTGLVANLAALEVAKWAVGHAGEGPIVRTIDLKTLQVSRHTVLRRPQCRVCGDPDVQAQRLAEPVVLTDDERPARVSLEDFSSLVSGITGIVTRLARAETGMPSLHSYTAYFGFGRGAPDLPSVKNALLSQASGVGRNEDEAKIGAICEAIERYSGMYHGDEPAITASWSQLDPQTSIHPGACMLYSGRQYEMREEINSRGNAFDLVPRPFDATATMHWTGVWSLTAQRFKLLPSTYLFYGFPQPPGGPYCWADSNGCAAGRTLTDAIHRGMLELIERDSVAIWWYNRLRRPRIDLASFHCDYFDAFVGDYARLNREVWVLDVTTDLDVPSVVAVSRFIGAGREDLLVSFGAHEDAQVAIEHALNEMNHLLPAVLPENRTAAGDYPYPEPAQKQWWRTASLESEPYLIPDPDRPALRASELGGVVGLRSEKARVAALCTRLEERGLEVLVLNQTRPDIRTAVAKVIVPGMRHFWARFAPGRLYDVPVSMGWRDRRCCEEELNPVSMFL